jgi:hypothetical protein
MDDSQISVKLGISVQFERFERYLHLFITIADCTVYGGTIYEYYKLFLQKPKGAEPFSFHNTFTEFDRIPSFF